MVQGLKLYVKETRSTFKKITEEICKYIDEEYPPCKDMIRYVPTQSAWYLFLNFDKYKNKLSKIKYYYK